MKDINFLINNRVDIMYQGSTYRSILQDTGKNYMAISIPIKQGKYIAINEDDDFEAMYYEDVNVYRFKGRYISTRLENGVPQLLIEYPKQIIKIQRREYVRVKAVQYVTYVEINENNLSKKELDKLDFNKGSKGILIDLSGGGCKLKAYENRSANDIILINIPDDNGNIRVKGRVIRVDRDENKNPICAVRFIDIEDRTRERIIKLLFLLMRKQARTIKKGGLNVAIANSTDVREQIVKKYIPLVNYIASRVIIGKSKYVEYEDMVGYGIIGLMDAINKFDESKGMKFSTYASLRIKGSMIDAIRKNSPISKGAMDKLNRYNEAIEELQRRLLREPSDEEIAAELKISAAEVSNIEGYINHISVVSLEDILYSEDDEMPLMSTIEDTNSPSPERRFEENEELQYLAKAIETLQEKDRTVLALYYYEGFTLKEIGKVLNVTESRVCQLHSRAIVNLRKSLKELKYIS
jgi:RNA polymerase sigma factor FliA